MGEIGVPGGDNRRLLIMASGVIVVALIMMLFFFRSCGPKDPFAGYTTVYSNLDLKDAANVVTQLKALKIPYQLKDEGRTIAVPKNKADDARLGLAEKNLPTGGSVGWEIFDTSKLGTTDFDRRIQFVRAISGELSRTIKRIDAIFDARIQIVIPQTSLFEVTKVPVTASVLLQLKPGRSLSVEQVNGIVRLVASSVENLRPENVMIVDTFGNILSGLEQPLTAEAVAAAPAQASIYPAPAAPATQETTVLTKPKEIVSTTIETNAKEIAAMQIWQKTSLSPEEKALSKLKTKEEFENRLSSKAQTVVNKFYPPNSILVKVNVDLEEYRFDAQKKKMKKAVKLSSKAMKKYSAITPENIKRMTVVVLIDNRFNMTASLKKTTIETIKDVLSYHPARGDSLIIRQVPFHYATAAQGGIMQKTGQEGGSTSWVSGFNLFVIWNKIVFALGIILLIAIVVIIVRRKLGRKTNEEFEPGPQFEGRASAIEQIRAAVAQSPEKVAELLKKWLTEE